MSPLLRPITPLRAQIRPLRTSVAKCATGVRNLLTLAIETSCDDTAVAVLETQDQSYDSFDSTAPAARLLFNQKVTANNSAYQGVHPIASLESHQENLAHLVNAAIQHLPERSFRDSPNSRWQDFGGKMSRRLPDFISVTRGPGMRSNLCTGLDTAKGLATAWQIPIVGVNHMQAHALTPRLASALARPASRADDDKPEFPFLSLLVSGGHTLLIRSQSLVDHKIMASTADMAIGNALDMVAKAVLPPALLASASDIMYGALLEQFAFPDGEIDYNYVPSKTNGSKKATPWGWSLSPPLADSRNGEKSRAMEYSFTGLMTNVQRIMKFGWDKRRGKLGQEVPRGGEASLEERKDLAQHAMRVMFEHLASRIVLGLQNLARENPKGVAKLETLVVSGGVAANSYLRHLLPAFLALRAAHDRNIPHLALAFPPASLCTDNAAMIAWAGTEMFKAGHTTSMSCHALRKWPLDVLLDSTAAEHPDHVSQQARDELESGR